MSLRFIYGRLGSGKTTFCFNDIKEKINKWENAPIVLLVPDDYSFNAERKLLRAVGESGIMKAQVLSFKRMAYRVFAETGGLAKKHMNAAGRCMLIYRIMERRQDKLKIFKKAVKSQGFVDTMSDIIAELKTYDINPETLQATAERVEGSDILKDKLYDISMVYSEFEKALHEKYIDSGDDLKILSEKFDKSHMFDGAEVYIDGFTVLTPQQIKIIEKLLIKASRVNITLCIDGTKDKYTSDSTDVFWPIKSIEKKIIKIAGENNISMEEPVRLYENVALRFKGSLELSHLEKNIYSYPYSCYEGEVKDISIFKSLNRYSEVEYIAREVITLCREEDLRFSDIAVVTKDIEGYENLVGAIFKEYGIPYFIDKKRDINSNQLIILIVSAVEILVKGFTYETVFKYLKTGLTGINRDDIDLIENYVLACGIKGNRWIDDKAWDYWPDMSFGRGELPDDIKNELNRINDIRRSITAPLIKLRESVKGKKKAVDDAEALFDFLCSLSIPERIEKLIEEFKDRTELGLANEYSKVWNIFIDTLDQVVEVAGDDEMSLEQFSKILSIGFQEYKIGLIPPSVDQTMFGGVERLKGRDVKALFIMGVNDGVFPSSTSDEGILTDRDREKLKGLGIELALDTKEKVFEDQFLIYTTFASSRKYLKISYPIANHEGKTMRPSTIIAKIKKILPSIVEESNIIIDDKKEIDRVSRPEPTFNELISALGRGEDNGKVSPLWKDVYTWYRDNNTWKVKCQSTFSAKEYTNQVKSLGEDRVRNLYGKNLNFSISRLEKYSKCPFSYFVQYGLSVKERRVFELSAPDLGSFIHTILDRFSTYIDKNNISWRSLSKDFCENIISEIVDETVDNTSGSILGSSARYTFLKERLKKIILRAVWLISLHIKKGGFEPKGHEVIFGGGGDYPPITMDLPSGGKINLTGRIDRVDTLETEEGLYVRIVDYKSGNKDFNLSDVYNGLELQLLIYLDAILEYYKKNSSKPVIPGGILYFKIDDPIIRSGGEMNEEDIEKEIMKRLKMKGLLLSDVKVVREMDREIERYSVIIPAVLKDDGSLGSLSSTAESQDFDALRKHVKNKIIGLCEDMLSGNISINPYKKNRETSCRYCNFKSICKFDLSIKGNNYRIIRDKSKDEIWSEIRQDEAVTGGNS